mmetsp:Transcript_69178/g.200726  ORF Transcript_69178/g.200726 Transcript_69178/m.200726 type:complete len:280 (-) Transcript_69178:173-1012(-)
MMRRHAIGSSGGARGAATAPPHAPGACGVLERSPAWVRCREGLADIVGKWLSTHDVRPPTRPPTRLGEQHAAGKQARLPSHRKPEERSGHHCIEQDVSNPDPLEYHFEEQDVSNPDPIEFHFGEQEALNPSPMEFHLEALNPNPMEYRTPPGLNGGGTTMMVRNIPVECSQEQLLQEWPAELGYDLFYLPRSSKGKTNLGYAFLNFSSAVDAEAFRVRWHRKRFERLPMDKRLSVSLAVVQGFDANVAQLKQKPYGHLRSRHCQPVIIARGRQVRLQDL